MQAPKSVRALNKAAQTAARSVVCAFAEKHPLLLATRLAETPDMANGLKDFDYIVEQLLVGGQSDLLQKMLDSRSLGIYARRVLTEKLLTQ